MRLYERNLGSCLDTVAPVGPLENFANDGYEVKECVVALGDLKRTLTLEFGSCTGDGVGRKLAAGGNRGRQTGSVPADCSYQAGVVDYDDHTLPYGDVSAAAAENLAAADALVLVASGSPDFVVPWIF